MGPNARKVLEQVTDADVSNEAFPFGTCQQINIAGANVKALRITYVGELGWELHFPIEHALSVYKSLMDAGESHGIVNAGYRSIESLRLEKGYRAWSSDIGPDYSPFESGLGWAVKLKSNTPFMGREASVALKEKDRVKQLACFTVDDPDVVLLGRETIYRNGERVGWLSSGGFGYTIGKNIGYGYVRNPDGVSTEFLKSGSYELDVSTKRIPCNIEFGSLYDPTMECIKA
jgi:4-methylaminobutanoate oxidase (formaldehyde-forming)